MKDAIKDIIRSTAISIAMAMVIFCLSGIVFDISAEGTFSLEHYGFTKMVIGCILIGFGFGIPTIAYRSERLPMPIKVIIHMGIGIVVYTIVGYAVGWVGGASTIWKGLIIAAIQLSIAFIVWFIFMMHYRREAREINERIQAKK